MSTSYTRTSLECLYELQSHHPLEAYLDVVLGPVDAPDGHPQAAQAALAHVAGDGAAETRVAPETAAA